MKRTRKFQLACFVAALLCVSPVALCSGVSGVWIVHVQNPNHQVVATLKVQLTDKPATRSCMSGNWEAVRVISATTKVKDFFPISDPLVYQINGGQITLGRNVVCDGYMWLKGEFRETSARGGYFSVGLGTSSRRGYFTMHRVQ